MGEVRKGRQTPTQSVVLPYSSTYGAEAIDIYNSTGRTAQEWQELLLSDILAVNEEGLWVHTKFGYSVPRRNGKNEIVAIREMYGLKKGERILHTAHKVKFILGEDKHVKLLIRSPNDEPFTILSAHYSLLRYGEAEASGECEIDGHYLDVKISPQNKACYVLEITYVVGDSTRKARIEVEVI